MDDELPPDQEIVIKKETQYDEDMDIEKNRIIIRENNKANEQFLKTQFQEATKQGFWASCILCKPGFDATQGQCCCKFGNRRGTAIIKKFDMINFLITFRWIAAWLAHIDRRFYKGYYLVRMYTFVGLAILNYFTMLLIIIIDASEFSWAMYHVHFMWYISWALVSSAMLVTDLHWTQCIGF